MTEPAESSKPASSDARSRAPSKVRFRHTRRLGLIRFLAINIFVLFVPAAVYYALVTQRHAEEEVNRSFRHLNQLEFRFQQQFGRMAGFVVSQLNSHGLVRCNQKNTCASTTPVSTSAKTLLVSYVDRGVLPISGEATRTEWLKTLRYEASRASLRDVAFDPYVDVENTQFFPRPFWERDTSLVDDSNSADGSEPKIGYSLSAYDQGLRQDNSQPMGRVVFSYDRDKNPPRLHLRLKESLNISLSDYRSPENGRTNTRGIKGGGTKDSKEGKENREIPLLPSASVSFQALLEDVSSALPFAELYLVSEDGEIWADVSRNSQEPDAIRLQPDIARPDRYNQLRRVFSRAVREDSSHAGTKVLSSEKANDKDGSVPALSESGNPDKPMVVQDRLGESYFQVFIQPLHAVNAEVHWGATDPKCSSGENKSSEQEACTVKPPVLYLVALKQDRTIQDAISQLGPQSQAALGLVVCLLILSVPLIRISFLEAHDSISRSWLSLTMQCTALLIGVLTITALAIAMGRDVLTALDRARDNAATQIANHLNQEIDTAVVQFSMLRNAFFDALPELKSELEKIDASEIDAQGLVLEKCDQFLSTRTSFNWIEGTHVRPIGVAPAERDETHQASECALPQVQRTLWPIPSPPEKRPWSRIVSAYATDARGDLRGPRIDFFNRHDALSRGIRLAFRPYFDKLKNKQGWPLPQSANCPGGSFVIQRLFNLGDAEKLAQFAMTRDCSADRTAFTGIVSGEVRFGSVVDAVLPLGLQFAVVERSTGTVIFHSDDSKSLAENFFDEVRSTELRPTVEANRSFAFSGEYYGNKTRFRYVPISADIPWGLFVFYDPSRAEQSVLLTALTSLIALCAAMLACWLSLFLLSRIAGIRLSWAWPQWRLREAYVWFAAIEFLLLVIASLSVPGFENGWHPLAIFLMFWIFVTCGATLLSPDTINWQRRRRIVGCAHLVQVLAYFLLCLGLNDGKYASQACVLLLVHVVVFIALCKWLFRWRTGWSIRLSPSNPWMTRPRSLGPTFRASWPWSIFAKGANSSTAQFKRRYLLCLAMAAITVVAVPAWDLFRRAEDLHSNAQYEIYRMEANQALRRRETNFDDELKRLLGAQHKHDFNEFAAPDPNLRRNGIYLLAPCRAKASFSTWTLEPASYLFLPHQEPSCTPPSIHRPGWEAIVWSLMPSVSTSTATIKLLTENPPSTNGLRDMLGSQDAGAKADLAGARRPHDELAEVEYARDRILKLLSALSMAVLAVLLLIYVARHVLGAEMPWFGRYGALRKRFAFEQEWKDIRFTMLIRPDPSALRVKGQFKQFDLRRWPPSAADVERAVRAVGDSDVRLLELDHAVLNPERRQLLMELLERLVAREQGGVQLVVGIPPLFRVLKPAAYPEVPDDHRPQDEEALRWADVMARFKKVYRAAAQDGVRDVGRMHPISSDVRYLQLCELIVRETTIVRPDLGHLRAELVELLNSSFGTSEPLSDRDVLEYIETHAGAIFRRHWQTSTRDERLALYQLASGRFINPQNESVIAHLHRKHLVAFEPTPRIKSRAFASFVLRAEMPGKFEEWANEAAEGIWQTIRTPLLLVVFLMIAWLAYSAGDVFQALAAILVSTLTFFGQLMRAVGYTRGSSGLTTEH